MSAAETMFANSTANENTQAKSYGVHPSGKKVIQVVGDFDGATAKLQISLDGTNWFDVGSDATFADSDGGVVTIDYLGGALRWNIAGGSESTQDISAFIVG